MGRRDCAASYTPPRPLSETKAPDSLGGTTVTVRLSHACLRRYIQSRLGAMERIQCTIEIHFLMSAGQPLLGPLLSFLRAWYVDLFGLLRRLREDRNLGRQYLGE